MACLIAASSSLHGRRANTSRALIAVLLLTLACATRRPGDPVLPGLNLFSKEQDIELGREAAAQILKEVEVVNNPEVQGYIRGIGERLAAVPEAGEYPYSFTVVNDRSVNAFALPGGPVFVFTGVVSAADNEAQLAGVLAHEVAHIALRHGSSQASKANIIQLPAVLAGAVIGQGSLLARLGQLGLGLGVNSVLLRYSRQAETEADALGVRIMATAGYQPIELARFFDKLEAHGGSRAPEFLSSHPRPGSRLKHVQQEIQTLPVRRAYNTDSPEFRRIKGIIAGLTQPGRRVCE